MSPKLPSPSLPILLLGNRCRYSQSLPRGHRPRAKKRQKYEPGTLSARVYPESRATLHLPFAWCLEASASSLSPPDHLLYQMLKIVPVCGGGSVLNVLGSCCGRAGLRLRLITLVLRTFCTVPSPLVVASAVSVATGCSAAAATASATVVSAMLCIENKLCRFVGRASLKPVPEARGFALYKSYSEDIPCASRLSLHSSLYLIAPSSQCSRAFQDYT
jgi:hypothetical protein